MMPDDLDPTTSPNPTEYSLVIQMLGQCTAESSSQRTHDNG